MKLVVTKILSVLGIVLLAGCYSVNTSRPSEIDGLAIPGASDRASMSSKQLHSAIEVAHLDGQLTAEQARKAHLEIDETGHSTHEQLTAVQHDALGKERSIRRQRSS